MLRCVGIGDYVVDRYFNYGQMFPGGNALNFAVYAKQLGHESAFISVLSDDEYIELIKDTLKKWDVDFSRCVSAHGATWLCSTRHNGGDRTIADDNDGGVVVNQPLVITPDLENYVKGFDIIHTNVNGHLSNTELAELKALDVPIIYDYSDSWMAEEDLMEKAPYADFAFFSGKKLPQQELKRLLKKLVVDRGCSLAITTIGRAGAIVYNGHEYFIKKPYNLESKVVDTLGAGDSFLTGFITSYIGGKKQFGRITAGNAEKYCTAEDLRAFEQGLIKYAMNMGNLLAIRTCMVLGAIGGGVPLK